MSDDQNLTLYTAVYPSVTDALADLDGIEQLHKDEVIGKYDAAVIDKKGDKPHIAKRKDRPRIQIIPEAFGGESCLARSSKKRLRSSLLTRPG